MRIKSWEARVIQLEVIGAARECLPRLVTQYDCFEAYSPWCKEQAQNDGQQEETLTANIASTKSVIKNNATKVESTSSDTARASHISSSDSELTAAIAVRERRRRTSAHLKLN